MQTLKTSIVVTFMLLVLYSAYVALNAPQPKIPDELIGLADVESVDIDMGIDIPPLDPPPISDSSRKSSSERQAFGEAIPKTASSSPASSSAYATTAALTEDSIDSTLMRLPEPDPMVKGNDPDPKSSYPESIAANVKVPDPVSISLDGDAGAGFAMPGMNPPSGDRASASPPDANGIANAFETANRQVTEGRLREALFTLSIFYGSPDLSPSQQTKLLDMLDPLAGEVIYSQGHFIEPAHKVTRGETLTSIASQYKIPEELLANINQISNPDVVLPGTELKVMNGPFRAEVSLSRSEITLFLGDLYAGRFPITTGQNPPPTEGTFSVLDKQPGHEHYTADGRLIPKGSPENPFGEVWLDLGQQLAIHGSSSTAGTSDGCIRLSPVDARDIFGILAQGSPVSVRR